MESNLIISNTTPLINFAEIRRMDVLESLFGSIIIPPAVTDELAMKSVLFPNAARVPSLSSVSVLAPTDTMLVKSYAGHLHRGEAECLALALEHPGSLLLLDDLGAREFSATSGILYTGTLGCLSEAKKRGYITAIGPLLHQLRSQARFWISDRLEHRILREAGEL